MACAKLSVVFFELPDLYHEQWALSILPYPEIIPNDETIIQSPELRPNAHISRAAFEPRHPANFRGTMPIALIGPHDGDIVRDIVEAITVYHERCVLDSRAFVMDILKEFERAGIVDRHNDAYRFAKSELRNRRREIECMEPRH
jgi:hypothetical protein